MFTVPPLTPVTTPVVASIVAIGALPVLHVPPVVALARVMFWPTHTDDGPVIGDAVLTVIVVTPIQPAGVV